MPSAFLEEIPTDDDLWDVYRDTLLDAMIPLWRSWFLAGAIAGQEAMVVRAGAKELDAGEIMGAADAFIDNFVNAWWDRLRVSQQLILREAIRTARLEGWQPRRVAQMIAPQFGRERAELIAVTEITRLVGGGAQAAYRAEGYITWEWRTAEDRRVDDVCQARAGEAFPMSTAFEPAHPRCRCWPVPGELAP